MSSTSPAPTRTRPATIRRFTGVQRLLHLILTITFLGMLWTGLCLWSPALAEVMNRPLAKQWHFYSAIALGVAFVLILVLRPRDVRAFASAVDQLDRADRAWLRGGPRRLFSHVGAPEQGWLNAGQKLNTAIGGLRFKVEQAFGTMKRKFHLARARYFGTAKVQAQMCWAALGMNLLKAHRKLQRMQQSMDQGTGAPA